MKKEEVHRGVKVGVSTYHNHDHHISKQSDEINNGKHKEEEVLKVWVTCKSQENKLTCACLIFHSQHVSCKRRKKTSCQQAESGHTRVALADFQVTETGKQPTWCRIQCQEQELGCRQFQSQLRSRFSNKGAETALDVSCPPH